MVGEKDKIRHSQRFSSELEGACDWCVGLFPSLACDPMLHLLGALNLPVPGHHHSLLIIVHGKVICHHRCEVVVVYDTCDWDKRR